MMDALTRPFTAAWWSLVAWHRGRLDDDPDVQRAREQRARATRAVYRLDMQYGDLNRAAFGRDPWPREKGPRP